MDTEFANWPPGPSVTTGLVRLPPEMDPIWTVSATVVVMVVFFVMTVSAAASDETNAKPIAMTAR